jgi:hypothetical protein
MDLLLDQLRLQEVDHELKLLFESGLMSPDIQARSVSLMQSRARLKAMLTNPASVHLRHAAPRSKPGQTVNRACKKV